ncbi:30S ribosomal protein S4 [Gehongia tenuis]|uniref:Small ribosomal subunit protein uS4 n=1 Tax=Gehongia tenuis TaxID=2763655 RepID=A0A926D590_9FIRM|nr:30S ribosomal protein S4 [Gehongia tenuis]MBC8531582.1 30S ribosomal protein S4 [Gehongia tenuis]
MARYTGSVCRLCRREGAKLFLKGDRCYSQKCAFNKRPVPPGMHAQSRRKQSEYGIQLREKQKTRRIYGVLESQFRKYFEMAERMKGVTGENMLSLLERRLDNVVYRLGFADSRAQARQWVMHGHFTINGKKADIPSQLVEVDDVISIKDASKDMENFKALRENGSTSVPKWLDLDNANLAGKVLSLPQREDIDITIAEHLIVEFYSR